MGIAGSLQVEHWAVTYPLDTQLALNSRALRA